MGTDKHKDDDGGHDVIFVMSFRHWKTGQIIRSKDGRPFPIKVRRRRAG